MKKGFTLIELILVIAIITILSGVIFTISLNSFKNSKVEGFSSEALSLIRRLYDYQNNQMVFVDQVPSKNIEETYNIVFEIENEKLTIKLRNKEEVLDEVLSSNIAFIDDIKAAFSEEESKDFKPLTLRSPYIFSFDSKGRIVTNSGEEEVNNLKINISINNTYKNFITISTPPAGNIILKKGDENEKT